MSREQAFMTILEATAIMQEHVSVILQAKALEAEKAKKWICLHISDGSFADKEGQLKQCLEIHEKVIEVIEGLTKLENGLARNLKVVLNKDDAGGGFGGFGGMDGFDHDGGMGGMHDGGER
jgi:hypothetical protein